MENLKNHRKRIDELDKIIMDALNERMNISKTVGSYKLKNKIQTLDQTRENQILKLTNKYQNKKELKNIYKEIFLNSKNLQTYEYFLVGKKLDYSFSPEIHDHFGITNYNLYPTDNFLEIRNINFKGINITNPYKYSAYKLCDELDYSAKATEAVNTIVRRDNLLVGYNTDFFGFEKLLEYNNINVDSKKIIIVGNGATAKTIEEVLKLKNPKNIIKLVREIRGNDEYLINDFNQFTDYQIIINATPYGTYPNNKEEYLFALNDFNNLEALIDVIYNPKQSALLRNGQKGLKKVNGLMMLVAQAAKAASIFTNTNKLDLIEDVYKKLNFELTNIILIGMPFSGKSSLGIKLANKLNHSLIDLDIIMQENGHDLESILKSGSVSDFRKLEEEYAVKFAKERGLIISTGGGIINSKRAMNALKQNGIIVFIDEKLENLITRIDNTRPLIKSTQDLINLYNERYEIYKQYSDIVLNDFENLDKIEEKFYEYINS